MKKLLLLVIAFLPVLSFGQVDLATWALTSTGNVTTSQTYVTASNISCTGSTATYSTSGLGLANFSDNDLVHYRYFQITIKPTSGNVLNLTNLLFNQSKLSQGPTHYGIKYYISNDGTIPGDYDFFTNNSTWLVNQESISGNSTKNIALSQSLTSSQTMVIRFYAKGANDYNLAGWVIAANTLKIKGTNPNAVLTATADNASIIKNNFSNINVLSNDITPNATTISTVAVTQQSANGVAVVNADKTIKFTPNANYVGSTSFQYTITNSAGSSAVGTVNITVAEAVSSNLIVWNGTTTTPNVLNSSVTSSALTTAGGISIATNEGGHFRFNNNFAPYFFDKTRYIQFTATAVTGKKVIPTQFSFRYNSPNSTAGPKKYQVKYSKDNTFPADKTFILAGETTSVLGTDTDVALTFPTGTVVLPSETLYVRVYFYQNSPDYSDFYLKHSNGGATGPGISGYVLEYDATMLNANDDLANTNQAEPVNINVRGNDTGYNANAIVITQPTDNSGIVNVNPDNTVTFNPSDTYTGTTSFSYTISNGTTTATANVYVKVSVNNTNNLVIWNGTSNTVAPKIFNDNITASNITAQGGVSISSNEPNHFRFNNLPATAFDQTKYIQVSTTAEAGSTIIPSQFKFRYYSPSANNSGPKKYQVKFSKNSTFPAGETVVLAAETTAVLDADTDVTLNFPAGTEILPTTTLYVRIYAYENSVDYSNYYIRHDNGSTLGPAITGIVKNVSIFAAKNDNVTVAGVATAISVLANDFIAPSQLASTTISAVSTPSSGTAVINAATKTITYTPASGFIGSTSFTYTITNGTIYSTATVFVTVTAPPVVITAPTTISGNDNICGGDNVNLTASGGTAGTAVYEWGTGTVGSNIIAGQTTATLTHYPAGTTTYWVRRKDGATTTSAITKTVTVAYGDQTSYGTDKWIGYVYTWTGTPATTNYRGYVTENEIFDRNMAYDPIQGVETHLCAPPAENFMVRYKKKITFAPGNYNITVGGDDGYRLSIDGGSTWIIENWTGHAYVDTSVLAALSGEKNVVLEYYEGGGEARVSFSYGIIQGDPSVYGSNVWNVYAFNYYDNTDNQVLVPVNNYSGFYTQGTLGVDTRDITNNGWNQDFSPSSSVNWQGAPVPNDNFTITHKRQGFPCGRYQIVMENWDDKAILYIDEVQIWVVNGYNGGSVTLPGTYNLNKNTKVELRLKEGGGAAGIKMSLINLPSIHTNAGWTNGEPNNQAGLQIDNTYTVNTTDLEVCSCTVKAGQTLTVNSGRTLTVIENIVVETGGQIIVENNGSLVQKEDNATYTGLPTSFTIKRYTQPVRRYDFTYWSSPVRQQDWTLNNLSPNTLADKYYSYNPATGWVIHYVGNVGMETGRGYIVRAPQTFAINSQQIDENTKFTGIPNNGVKTFTTGAANSYNLIGNPYPGALDADKFILANQNSITGALYFWTHNTPVANYSYSAGDYATYTLLGGAGTQSANVGGVTPSGKIASGQAFFVQRKNNANAVITYNNDMRVTGNNNQFYKPSPTEADDTVYKHRFWLNVSNANNAYSEMLLGYMTGATDGFDDAYDGKTFGGSVIALYSKLDAANLVVQAKSLPFDENDVIPVGYTTTVAGEFTINLNQFDGIFDSQDIFLEDKLNNTITNLKEMNYAFTTAAGTFDNRFEVKFINTTLGIDTPTVDNNSMVIYRNGSQIDIKSKDQSIDQVIVYDLLGKVIFEKNKINAQNFSTAQLMVSNQVVIVKVITDSRAEMVKKVMMN